MKKINPYGFALAMTIDDNIKLVYEDVKEIGQGGPEVGRLRIGDKYIDKRKWFGGPILYTDGYIFVPMYRYGIFTLVRCNPKTFRIDKSNLKDKLILLNSIENGVISYYNSIDNSILLRANINELF